MAFLVVAGITVPVAWPEGAPANEVVEIGDRMRAFDGTMLSSIRARKREQPVITHPMALAARDTLRAVLTGSPPITCSGDLLGGSGSYDASGLSDRVITGSGGRHYVLSFVLHEI
jgi:hypothetical protein